MPDLIPHHEPRILSREGEWTTWEYRGATVRSCGIHNTLTMAGHPLDGTSQGFAEALFRLVDHWLDHGKLPPPYVWPVPPRQG